MEALAPATAALSFVTVFFGLVAGTVLAIIAEEEVKPGIRYFLMFQKALLGVFLLFLLCFFLKNILLAALLGLVVVTFVLWCALKKAKVEALSAALLRTTPFIYLFFGVALSLIKEKGMFALASSIIFLFGLPTGTMIHYELSKSKERSFFSFAKELLKHAGFFLGLFLYLLA